MVAVACDYHRRRHAGPEKKGRELPAGDFYRDWARAEFGASVADKVADIFTKLDGRFPRASSWNRGPGPVIIQRKSWLSVKPSYNFVDEMAALRDQVKGAGNLERFDYWLNTFRFGRSTAKLACARGRLDAVMTQVQKQKEPGLKKKRVMEERCRQSERSSNRPGKLSRICLPPSITPASWGHWRIWNSNHS